MHGNRRIVFGSGERDGHGLIPEVLETGWGHFSAADNGHLKPHTHTDAFELCFILSGEVEWVTADSTEVLRSGDLYITQPNEVHWGRDAAMHPCSLHWLILGSYGCGFEWPGIDRELAAHLDARLRRMRTHRLRGTPKMRMAFEEVFEEHRSDSNHPEQGLLRQGNARAALLRLLIELVRAYDSQTAADAAQDRLRKLPRRSAQVIGALHAHAHEADAIRLACHLLGLDHDRVNREFIEHLGTTISQYWLRERVRLARERLLEGPASVTEISTQLGFSSSQHFATVFRKVTGLTPSQYRTAALNEPHGFQALRREAG